MYAYVNTDNHQLQLLLGGGGVRKEFRHKLQQLDQFMIYHRYQILDQRPYQTQTHELQYQHRFMMWGRHMLIWGCIFDFSIIKVINVKFLIPVSSTETGTFPRIEELSQLIPSGSLCVALVSFSIVFNQTNYSLLGHVEQLKICSYLCAPEHPFFWRVMGDSAPQINLNLTFLRESQLGKSLLKEDEQSSSHQCQQEGCYALSLILCQGFHERLGSESPLQVIDQTLLRTIVSFTTEHDFNSPDDPDSNGGGGETPHLIFFHSNYIIR